MITQTEVNSRNKKFWKQTSSDKSCLRTIKFIGGGCMLNIFELCSKFFSPIFANSSSWNQKGQDCSNFGTLKPICTKLHIASLALCRIPELIWLIKILKNLVFGEMVKQKSNRNVQQNGEPHRPHQLAHVSDSDVSTGDTKHFEWVYVDHTRDHYSTQVKN